MGCARVPCSAGLLRRCSAGRRPSSCHPLPQGLAELGYEIVSTGGSATAIEAAGVPVKRVEELTGFPEMLDGALAQCIMCFVSGCTDLGRGRS